MIKRVVHAALFASMAAAASVNAQTTPSFDVSGNGLLKGTYYFREVAYLVGDQSGNMSDAVAVNGNITFDGNGSYTFYGTYYDAYTGKQQTIPSTSGGTYGIAASGLGYITNPISSGDNIYGLVSNGIFIGSTTENQSGFNDIFAAAPVASPAATNSTLQGTYSVAHVDFPDLGVGDNRDSSFQLTADGNGNFSTINVTGYIASRGTTAITQTISGAHYSFSNGAANVSFGGSLTASTNLIAGGKVLYISPDGNFIFGGSAFGVDMFFGVRTTSGSNGTLSGLYYQAGLTEDDSGGYGNLDSFYGSFSATSGIVIDHQRIFSPFFGAYGATFNDSYTAGTNGNYTSPDGSTQYFVGANGSIRIGSGIFPYLGISAALKSPTFTGPGVYLSPTGVQNAGSWSPFTAGLSRGEFIALTGTNLAPSVSIAGTTPLPTNLNGVQVMINNRPAPIYYVTPTLITAIVPFATELNVAQIQVINNNVASNTVTVFMDLTEPGVFTNPADGVGYAAALHTDYSKVTPQSPAQIGEVVSVYLTGLGDVTPTNPDGALGPVPASTTTNPVTVAVDGITATVSFAGLAPDLVGLYQVNFTVPAGVSNGDVYLDIAGPDSSSTEALLSVGTPVTAASATAAVRSSRSAVMRACRADVPAGSIGRLAAPKAGCAPAIRTVIPRQFSRSLASQLR